MHFIQHHVLQFLVIHRTKIDICFQRFSERIKTQNKTDIHSYHTFTLREARVSCTGEMWNNLEIMSPRKMCLGFLGNHSETPSREIFWTQGQYSASTTCCCLHCSREQAPELWSYVVQTCCYSCRYLFQLYHSKSLLCLYLYRSVSTVSSVARKDCKCVRPWRVT